MSEFNTQNFIDHCKQNERDFGEVKETLNKIKDNHIAHLTESITKVDKTLTEVKINQDWLLKYFWTVTAGVLGALVVGVLNLITK